MVDLFSVVSLGMLVFVASANATNNPSSTARTFDGVTASFVLIDPHVHKPDMPLRIRVNLRNVSSKPTTFRYVDPFILHVRIYDSAGHEVPLKPMVAIGEPAASVISLKPGEEYHSTATVKLWAYYDLAPGKYHLKLVYDVRLISDQAQAAQYSKMAKSEPWVKWNEKAYIFLVVK